MPRWTDELERREAVRTPHRLPCSVWVDGDRRDGVLEQASARAVLVRMEERLPEAREIQVTFATPESVTIALRTEPARERSVPHRLRSLTPPSVVMHVLEPTDAFLRWIEPLAASAAEEEAP